MLIKYADESAGSQLVFASNNATDATKRPRMIVDWEPLVGVRTPFGYQDFDLGVAQAKVNLASGNLWVGEGDLGIAGTGIDAVVQRFYNSRSPYFGSTGGRWNMWPQSLEGIRESSAKDLLWRGGPSGDLVFSPTGRYDGSLTEPHGYRATVGVGVGLRWNVVSHEDGSRTLFYATEMTTTQGDTWGFGYDPVGNPTTVSDPQAASATLAYNANGTVSSSTDAKGATTTYGYHPSGNLKTITPPAPLGATTIATTGCRGPPP